MPALSFGAIEILPALLSKTKVQTIRPLFCIGGCEGKHHSGRMHLPRLKVGDKVKLYWKMRSKVKYFCLSCGNAVEGGVCICGTSATAKCSKHGINGAFHKLLGEVEITEVFEIFMQTLRAKDDPVARSQGGQEEMGLRVTDANGNDVFDEFEEELMERDGFTDGMQFHDWFDSHYDLSQPSRFAVYRWHWLSTTT